MLLSDAKTKFEDKFYSVDPAKSIHGDPDLRHICSGGICGPKDILPCLYSTKDRAIEAWLDVATSLIDPEDAILEWVLVPEMCEYQMTMADRLQQQRLVANRYAVRSQFRTR